MNASRRPPEGISSGFTLVEVGMIAVSVLLVLFLMAYPRTYKRGSAQSKRQVCQNRMKGIAIGLILYSNDYRFFPHMTSLSKEHTPTDISKVYRTLIHFRYVDTPEEFICPGSADQAVSAGWEGTVPKPKAPKLWTWAGKVESAPVPPVLGPVGPSLADNRELSYTARRRALNAATATSKDLVAGDKALKPAGEVDGSSSGNHESGTVAVFADGHADFVRREAPRAELDTLYGELLMLDPRGRVIPAPPKAGAASGRATPPKPGAAPGGE